MRIQERVRPEQVLVIGIFVILWISGVMIVLEDSSSESATAAPNNSKQYKSPGQAPYLEDRQLVSMHNERLNRNARWLSYVNVVYLQDVTEWTATVERNNVAAWDAALARAARERLERAVVERESTTAPTSPATAAPPVVAPTGGVPGMIYQVWTPAVGAGVAAQAVRVASCESAGFTDYVNESNYNVIGPFQIDRRYHSGDLWSEYGNVQAALAIYQGSGWRPWECARRLGYT